MKIATATNAKNDNAVLYLNFFRIYIFVIFLKISILFLLKNDFLIIIVG